MKYFSRRIANRWNHLDQHVVDVLSINSFKNKLQQIRETRIGFYGSPQKTLRASPVDWPQLRPQQVKNQVKRCKVVRVTVIGMFTLTLSLTVGSCC